MDYVIVPAISVSGKKISSENINEKSFEHATDRSYHVTDVSVSSIISD